ncbi:glycosyltransferase family 2 protein [Microbacterium sp. HA-8]|uniref:glycosyltransferase family 2 protein n=1 Tax=Microbacterium sp. HA-8 TaxID=3234200 RepID=UPI0038F716F6
MTRPGDSDITMVVTTLGRIDYLERLIRSLIPQLSERDTLVIVAQANVAQTRALAERHRSALSARLIVGESARGASRGRNVGVGLSQTRHDDLLLFPNDTSWFPAGSVASIRSGIGDASGCVTVRAPEGDRFSLPAPGTPLDRRNVWQVIEMGLAIRRSAFVGLGGFDEALGTGAPTPWQAGEVTDLLLRWLATSPESARRFVWLPPHSAWIGGIAEGEGLSSREARWKLRAYGRGIARVYRRHRYPLLLQLAHIAAGAIIGLRRHSEYPLVAGVPAFLGRLEGFCGTTLGRGRTAVRR